jgi:hypothetical protein
LPYAADVAPFRGPAGVLAIVLLEIALGSIAVLWVTPVWGVVKRGFFLLVASTAAVCAALSLLSARGPLDRIGAASRGATLALAVFTALCVLFTVLLVLKLLPLARVAGIVAAVSGVWAVVALALLRGGGATAVKGSVAMLTGAAFLGATWDGMVLGHWYLARGGEPSAAEGQLNPLLLVSSLTLYLAVGLVAVNGLLAFFVHKLVGEGSIRAATGMLYLAVILSLSAEFAAKARFFTV